MNNTSTIIATTLEAEFHPSHLHVEDESWKHAGHAGAKEHGGGHFVVHITSQHFDSLSRPQAHRMIFKALDSLFPSSIHALSIKIIA